MDTKTLVIGAILIGGGFYLYSKHQAAAAVAPSLEARANAALATETNPIILEALAHECDKAGLTTLAGLLDAKAQAMSQLSKPGTIQSIQVHPAATIPMIAAGAPATIATRTLAQAMLSGSVHAPRYIQPNPNDPSLAPPGL